MKWRQLKASSTKSVATSETTIWSGQVLQAPGIVVLIDDTGNSNNLTVKLYRGIDGTNYEQSYYFTGTLNEFDPAANKAINTNTHTANTVVGYHLPFPWGYPYFKITGTKATGAETVTYEVWGQRE